MTSELPSTAGGANEPLISALDQATLFLAVEEGNVKTFEAIVKRSIDVNAYNDEGFTPLMSAVRGYETKRNLDLFRLLLQHGAKVGLKAAVTPSAPAIVIVRHDGKHEPGDKTMHTKPVHLDHKSPLLVALELKSALYLKGWEYRHWDPLLLLLAEAQVKELQQEDLDVRFQEASIPLSVLQGWTRLFQSGQHEVVELWAEGSYVSVLKEMLVANSEVLRKNLELDTSGRLDIRDTSFTVVTKIVEFLYTGSVEPEFMQARGCDLFHAAHIYGLDALARYCEPLIVCTPANWIKTLSAALQSDSHPLALKCAASIEAELGKRREHHEQHQWVFSELLHPEGGPPNTASLPP
eukprot:TRINITY_DN1078_c0_g2_i1.p1 TRINITY_DN1078_c0_g2~~TRINITY_DN1078_c0_g2_i1.p1  ORF type:complete len:351 (-),score=79.74 TRINITY_DN1078_c0_g2_i1:787-1839(-)